jgi:hypothetical protein
MRMWMVDPKILCQKHLCGEHLECHMFLGSIKKGKKINGFLNNNLFEPESLKKRHDALADEMVNRDYNHQTTMSSCDFENCVNTLNEGLRRVKINKNKSFNDLISRCPDCKNRYEVLKNE